MADIWEEMYLKAKKLLGTRKISPFIDAGEVSAAVLGESGHIYTGVSIGTSCETGMCAERNAIAHLITHGESRILKVLAIMPDGKIGPPCGVCREFMMQLHPLSGEAEVLLNFETRAVKTLGELMPNWWGEAEFK